MYDAGKIIPGLVIFLCLFTFPFWYNVANGKASQRPELVIDAAEKQCVESKEFMRIMHMDLLNQWRDEVVRNDNRVYLSTDGSKHTMSLSNTCMKCHANRTQFCDQCHDYMGVTPYCWDCHIQPRESK
ncbi:MAG: cytochrome C [Candidatus Omnitrophota bacterium]|jgi:hypothetical protein|nr:MAG: cytochrome C [Candidatus Omnitrophota bacterium]